MDTDGLFDVSVHGDATCLANVGHGKNVSKQERIVLDCTKIGHVSYKSGLLGATICVNDKMSRTFSNIAVVCCIFENRDGQLAVKQHPGIWN